MRDVTHLVAELCQFNYWNLEHEELTYGGACVAYSSMWFYVFRIFCCIQNILFEFYVKHIVYANWNVKSVT